jgi:hypothetical protein
VKNKLIIVLLALPMALKSNAQAPSYYAHKKKQAYFFWGWNCAAYSKSDISLKGADYDFSIYDVVAHDRQTYPIAFNPYLKPGAMTIPQTNFKLGYFIKDGLAINAGLDHMKYVMDQYQTVNMYGTITREGKYKGEYHGPQVMEDDLLTFEHTDGLNYINAEIENMQSSFNLSVGRFR